MKGIYWVFFFHPDGHQLKLIIRDDNSLDAVMKAEIIAQEMNSEFKYSHHNACR